MAATQTLKGGENVLVNAGGTHYQVALSYTSNTLATNIAEGTNGQNGATSTTTSTALVSQAGANYPQPIGTVRAYAMSGGRVGIIVDGSTQNTELTINPLGQQQRKGFAKSFAYGTAARGHILNIGQITVNSGADRRHRGLPGRRPLRSAGRQRHDGNRPDRLRRDSARCVDHDRRRREHARRAQRNHLDGNEHQHRPRPEPLNVGGNIELSNGSQFNIGRNLGLVSQPPKGTGTGTNVLTLNFTSVANSIVTVTIPAVGAYIQGNVIIDPDELVQYRATTRETSITRCTSRGP